MLADGLGCFKRAVDAQDTTAVLRNLSWPRRSKDLFCSDAWKLKACKRQSMVILVALGVFRAEKTD